MHSVSDFIMEIAQLEKPASRTKCKEQNVNFYLSSWGNSSLHSSPILSYEGALSLHRTEV